MGGGKERGEEEGSHLDTSELSVVSSASANHVRVHRLLFEFFFLSLNFKNTFSDGNFRRKKKEGEK